MYQSKSKSSINNKGSVCPTSSEIFQAKNLPSSSYIYEKYRQMKQKADSSLEPKKVEMSSAFDCGESTKQKRGIMVKLGKGIQVLTVFVMTLSPIFMLLLPRIYQEKIPDEFLVCNGDCLVSVFAAVFRILMMLPLNLMITSTLARVPNLPVRKYFLSMQFMILFSGWVLYVIYVFDKTFTYYNVAIFVVYFADLILFSLLLFVVFLWRSKTGATCWAVSVVESPGGRRFSCGVGPEGIREMAGCVIERFYWERTEVEYRRWGSQVSTRMSSVRQCRSEVCRSRRFHEEEGKVAKLEKSKWRLVDDCENLFGGNQIRNIDTIFSGISKNLEKYLQISGQYFRYSVRMVKENISRYKAFGMSGKAFFSLYSGETMTAEREGKCREKLWKMVRTPAVGTEDVNFYLTDDATTLHCMAYKIEKYQISEINTEFV